MANPDRPTRPTFYEIVMAGSHKLVRGFMTGLLMGRDDGGEVFFHFWEGISHEKFPERLAEAVHLLPEDCHLLVDSNTRKLLQKYAAPLEKQLGLRILSNRHIRSAHFPLRFEAYARRYDVEIMGLLENLPPGARLEDFERKEKVHKKATGLEAYAAAHDFEVKGHGVVTGRVDEVIRSRRQLDAHPLVKVGKIQLNLA